MRIIQYKTFSLKAHKKNWQRDIPNVCQFELTYNCGLHCRHCYSDCFNRAKQIKKELKAREIKTILDKIKKLGIFWLCFTGGDPLTRKDFLEIYNYAREKGFLTTVFTNGYSLTSQIADHLARQPPFVIEITLNASDKDTYEAISGVKGSFEKTMDGLRLILKKKLPLKVKTLVTRQNYQHLPALKVFLKARKLKFHPSYIIHSRLNHDNSPCSLRLNPQEILALQRLKADERIEWQGEGADCAQCSTFPKGVPATLEHKKTPSRGIFSCAAGSKDSINLDPYGKMFFCLSLRKPEIDFLGSSLGEIEEGRKKFFRFAQAQFKSESKCRHCELVDFCFGCPGKRFLETADLEAPVDYFCRLAQACKMSFS